MVDENELIYENGKVIGKVILRGKYGDVIDIEAPEPEYTVGKDGKRGLRIKPALIGDIVYKKMTLPQFKAEFPDWRYTVSFLGEPPMYDYYGHKDGKTYWLHMDEEDVAEAVEQEAGA